MLRDDIKRIEELQDDMSNAMDDERSKAEWRTPLNMAERGGHKDVVAFLRAAGARE